VGQGIVAVECAINDWQTRKYLALIDDAAAHLSCDANARCCGSSMATAIRRSRGIRQSKVR
jgi:porphobilinogen deaminase